VKEKVYRAEDLIIQGWEQLRENQVLRVVPHVFNDNSNEVALLQILFKNKKIFAKLNKHQVYDILSFTEWVTSSFFSANLIPKFKKGGTTYVGPEDHLGNVILIEFAKADTYYLRYIETKEEIQLNKMIAALYRPALPLWKRLLTNDKRKPFNPDTIDEEAKAFENLKKELKQYIILFFIGCKEMLYNTYELFRNDEDEEGEVKKATHEKTFGWAGIIYDLAETPVFAGLEAAKKANLHTALIYLNKKAIENKKELERQRNQLKAHENKRY
jgi:hypothetical protein